ncbi:MAG: hypothetical protein WAM42_24635 [Candidatus Nitrosopolaris sp.]
MAKSLSSKIPDFTRLGILSLTWTSEHYDLEYVKSLVTRSSFEIINIQPCVKKDRLFRHYDTVLKGAVLTTFGGVLFGFLLNISIRSANQMHRRRLVGRGQIKCTNSFIYS